MAISESLDRRKFNSTQKIISSLFATVQSKIEPHNRIQKKLDNSREKLSEFLSENSTLEVLPNTVEAKQSVDILRRRKIYTYTFDSLLAIPAIRLIFEESINIKIPAIPAVAIGIGISSMLLNLALEYRIDDINKNPNKATIGFKRFVENLSFMIPLFFIPSIGLFLVLSNPKNPSNMLYIFFLAFAFLINLKTASYSGQYSLIQRTKILEDEVKKLNDEIKQNNEALEAITNDVSKLRIQILNLAGELRRLWESFPKNNKPVVFLSPQHIYWLNNHVYLNQVLPIGELVISKDDPNSNIARFSTGFERISNPKQEQSIENRVPVLETTENNKRAIPNPEPIINKQDEENILDDEPILDKTDNLDNTEEQRVSTPDESAGKEIHDGLKWI